MSNLFSIKDIKNAPINNSNDYNFVYQMSEDILKSSSVNRLFYYICKFLSCNLNCNTSQGYICINNTLYLVSDYNYDINQFKLIDYIPCSIVNSELHICKDYLIRNFRKSKDVLYGENTVLQRYRSLKNKTFVPLYCDDFFYGFILMNGKIPFAHKDDFTINSLKLLYLQACVTLKHLCNDDVNLYFNLPLNICHPFFITKLDELERFTCLVSIDGTILNCSTGCMDVLKFNTYNLINSSIYNYIHPDYKSKFSTMCKALLREKKSFTVEIMMHTKYYIYIPVKATLKCSFDEDNNINGIFVVVSKLDYSDEQIQRELAPLDSGRIDTKANELFTSSTQGLFILKDSNFAYINDIGISYLSSKNIIRWENNNFDSYFELITVNDTDEPSEFVNCNNDCQFHSLQKLVESKYENNVQRFTTKVKRKSDGFILDLTFYLSPLSETIIEGTIVTFIKCNNLNNNIDELKKNIEETNKMLNSALMSEKMRCDFFANLSHDLRTPVNVIYSALQLLDVELPKYINNLQNTPVIKRTKTMRQNCYRLIKLINNIVDSTKIESGYLHLCVAYYDIVYLVENITNSITEYTENKHINLIFDTDIEEKSTYCDIEKIERIMLNLLSNAIKFTPENGSILVNMSDKGSYMLISVQDTGIGIPPKKLKCIFDRFTQVDCCRAAEKQGSGIGLNLVKSLVEMHKGEIWVESYEGQHTTFYIKLPYCNSPQALGDNVIVQSTVIEKDNTQSIQIELSDLYF
ncbi:Signal transduction histidine kinase [Hathewaya proteolytica DSM 3090]|uniref:histidine kinase n=1 Tax=Hathewaya proteolytica DSM 3090 TaxID=1121331 RepID=A0A1M6LYV1_9CLOT|nr:PAS domain-containing sensor histidine kinase [Hathewaya proteolytica]SHJ76386.1 Signal transduction histidine kinase [Hathewaya proteolytica DSM 3090]